MHLDDLFKVTEFFSGIQSQHKDLGGSISVDIKLVTSEAGCIGKDELGSAAVTCNPKSQCFKITEISFSCVLRIHPGSTTGLHSAALIPDFSWLMELSQSAVLPGTRVEGNEGILQYHITGLESLLLEVILPLLFTCNWLKQVT